jgi:anti-sigma B factor antagonist
VKISKRQDGQVVVLDLAGRLVGRGAASLVEEALRALGRAGTHTLVVNLRGVNSIDSAGLAGLVEGHREVRAGGGELRLAGVTRKIGDLVMITRLATLFNLFESVAQAIEGPIATHPTPRRML